MSRILCGMVAIGIGMAVIPATAEAQACWCAPQTTFVQPVATVQPTVWVQPTAFVQPATVVYRPVLRPFTTVAVPTTQTVFYAPQQVVVARPTIPVVPVASPTVIRTRYRPILGGTVTRVW